MGEFKDFRLAGQLVLDCKTVCIASLSAVWGRIPFSTQAWCQMRSHAGERILLSSFPDDKQMFSCAVVLCWPWQICEAISNGSHCTPRAIGAILESQCILFGNSVNQSPSYWLSLACSHMPFNMYERKKAKVQAIYVWKIVWRSCNCSCVVTACCGWGSSWFPYPLSGGSGCSRGSHNTAAPSSSWSVRLRDGGRRVEQD